MKELLQWIDPAQAMPDVEERVLLWLREPGGSMDWDAGHHNGERRQDMPGLGATALGPTPEFSRRRSAGTAELNGPRARAYEYQGGPARVRSSEWFGLVPKRGRL